MLDADVGAGTGASVFLASLLDHPDFTPEHARTHPPRRSGRRAGAASRSPSARPRNGIAIVRAYGSTEHPSVTGCGVRRPGRQAARTDGAPLPGVEIRLLDDDGEPVAAGEPGEIWSRGPDLCVGYTDPALTADAFDADGWYRTGDMGVLDADGYPHDHRPREGRHHPRRREHLGRRGRGGASPRSPKVAEVAVVAAPDERLGEHACAVVRLAPGVADARARATSPPRSSGSGWRGRSGPRSCASSTTSRAPPSGKIRKVDLRRQLRAGRDAADR